MPPENPIPQLAVRLRSASRITVLTGAGVSAASGVPTFRGSGGLWRTHRAEQLATPVRSRATLSWFGGGTTGAGSACRAASPTGPTTCSPPGADESISSRSSPKMSTACTNELTPAASSAFTGPSGSSSVGLDARRHPAAGGTTPCHSHAFLLAAHTAVVSPALVSCGSVNRSTPG